MDPKDHEFFTENVRLFDSFAGMFGKLAPAVEKLRNDLIKWENQSVSYEKRIKVAEEKLSDIEMKIKERTAMAEMGAKQLMHRLDEQQRNVIEREAAVAYKEGVIREHQDKARQLLSAAEGKVAQLRGKSLQAA